MPDPKVKGLGNGLAQGLCPVGVNTGHTNHMLSLGEFRDLMETVNLFIKISKAETVHTCYHNDRAIVT